MAVGVEGSSSGRRWAPAVLRGDSWQPSADAVTLEDGKNVRTHKCRFMRTADATAVEEKGKQTDATRRRDRAESATRSMIMNMYKRGVIMTMKRDDD